MCLRDSADLKNKCIYPDRSYDLFLTCGRQNNVSLSHNHTITIIDTHANHSFQPTR